MRISVIGAALVSLAVAACSGGAAPSAPASPREEAAPVTASVSAMSPEEFVARRKAGESLVLVDVRTPEENQAARIPGGLVMPHDRTRELAPQLLPAKDSTIVLYCRSGRRSGLAAETLVKLGYTRVYNLGGINDWPYEKETGAAP